MTTGKRIKVYRDKAGKYRWQMWSSSDVVADSGQGYAFEESAIEAAHEYHPGVTIEIVASAKDDE